MRTQSTTLLMPGVEIPNGYAYCMACPWAVANQDDPQALAQRHHDETGHPTIAKRPQA